MPAPSPFVLNKRHLRAHFERAAVTYEAAAVLQRQVADNMLTRLDAIKHPPARILDAGCGTGYGTRTLARRYRSASLTGVDLAQAMTAQARRATGWFGQKRFVCADAERLPFAGEAFDMVWSNLMLQWCDPAAALAEFLRVLAPSGLLMFTTFGPDTLRELKAAWRGIDNAGHVHGFLDMHDLGDALVRAGFADPVMDVEHYTLTYADVDGVLGDLKAIGAGNAQRTRSRGLTGRDRFRRFRMAYEAMAQDGRIPATYEVVYGHAWVPAVRLQRHGATATIPLSQIRRRR
ncbi:MAG: malonyl-ACP O-methyltransferase BioC [Gammaproteobacteria bacterium]|nr:malonyl-ACP O-methyltransferase BioC [Gammaproteobacteria bacterium]